jgi:hypothetical protein
MLRILLIIDNILLWIIDFFFYSHLSMSHIIVSLHITLFNLTTELPFVLLLNRVFRPIFYSGSSG